jgi:hypothetical protein
VSISAFTNAVIQPRFIAVPLAVFGVKPGTTRPATLAGPLEYRPGRTHGPEWFDSWSYPGRCPPLQAVTGASVAHEDDATEIRWRAAGPGVRYQIYLGSPGGTYRLLRTTTASSVMLFNLTRGRRYQVLIVPENVKHQKGPGTTIAVSSA